MPTSVSTAVAFGLLIVPGFMAVSGFSASRARSSPDRDLYAVAQAVVVSLVWLLAAYLVQSPWNVTQDWGLLPIDEQKLASHRQEIAAAALGLVVLGPFAAGAAWGGLLNRLRHKGGDALDRPEAWEAGWAWARDSAEGEVKIMRPPAPVRVTAVLSDGRVIKGTSKREVDVAYAPQASRDMFLQEAVEYAVDGSVVRESEVGAYVAGSQLAAVFFEHQQGDGASSER